MLANRSTVNMVLRKLKIIATFGFLAASECTKLVFGRGSAPDQRCAPTNWWSARRWMVLSKNMDSRAAIYILWSYDIRRRRATHFLSDERALKQRTRWTAVFFLVLQGSATSPVISAGPLASKS